MEAKPAEGQQDILQSSRTGSTRGAQDENKHNSTQANTGGKQALGNPGQLRFAKVGASTDRRGQGSQGCCSTGSLEPWGLVMVQGALHSPAPAAADRAGPCRPPPPPPAGDVCFGTTAPRQARATLRLLRQGQTKAEVSLATGWMKAAGASCSSLPGGQGQSPVSPAQSPGEPTQPGPAAAHAELPKLSIQERGCQGSSRRAARDSRALTYASPH